MINCKESSTSHSEANNNINFSYYSHMSNIEADNTFKNIISNCRSSNTHVDRIYFHCYSNFNEPETLLFKALIDHDYCSKRDELVSKDIYKRRRVFVDNEENITISILYKRRDMFNSSYPDLRIILDNPDIKTIDYFDAVCNSFGFTTTLSIVELAIDFYSSISFLKEYLCRNIILKYHRGACGFQGGEWVAP